MFMIEQSILIEFFGDNPLIRIVDYLIEKRPFDTTKEEIIRKTGISRMSLFKYWKKIENFGVVKKTREIGRASLFVLNDENPIVQKLLVLEGELIKRTMNIDSEKVAVKTMK